MKIIAAKRLGVEVALLLIAIMGYASENIVEKREGKVGIAASLLTSPGCADTILHLAHRYEPNFIELETCCDIYRPSHKPPYIARVLDACPLMPHHEPQSVVCTREVLLNQKNASLVNVVGSSSADPETVQQQVTTLMKWFHRPWFRPLMPCELIFSVYGSTMEGFVSMAKRAVDMRVPYVSVNLSCPNGLYEGDMPYKDPKQVSELVSHMTHVLKSIPLIVKVGAFRADEYELLESVIQAMVSGKRKAYAIYGINSMPVRAVDQSGKPIFGAERAVCGATGFHIKDAALAFVKMAHSIITKNKYDLALFACGGVGTIDDFATFFSAGADVVLSATALMINENFSFPKRYARYAHAKL